MRWMPSVIRQITPAFAYSPARGRCSSLGNCFRWANGDDRTNPFLLVEPPEWVPGTRPEELPADPNGPLPPLGTRPGFARSQMADGRWRVFDKPLNEAQIRPMVYLAKPK